MSRKKLTVAVVSILLTVFLQPIATSLADDSSDGPSAGNSPWASGETPGGSSLSRGKDGGVYLPTRNAESAPKVGDGLGLGPVKYHAKGTVIVNPNIYLIWYGSWDLNSCSEPSGTTSTVSITKDLISNLGDSSWNNINTTFYQKIKGEKTFVSSAIRYSGCTVDSASLGTNLDAVGGAQVSDVVSRAIKNRSLPSDEQGVYLVLTSSDISVAGFLTQFCGYHSSFATPKAAIKYGFIGDPSANLASCAAQRLVSPNNNPAADAMASIIAHEVVEAISDPEGLSWFDKAGYENADKCAWRFGTATKIANGSFMNMTLGQRPYLIQQNVAANTNTCLSGLQEK